VIVGGCKVLVAGIERENYEEFSPVLQRRELQVDLVPTAEAGITLAASVKFNVIILSAESREQTLEEVVRGIRAAKGQSRGAAVLVLAKPEQVDEAQALMEKGVTRVMLVDDPPEIIGQQVAGMLEIAPRVETRLSTRLDTALGDSANQLFCQTENVSASGMLVRTQRRLSLGETVAFEIHVGDQEDGPIAGRGEVVRYARPDREGVDGIGIHFLGFASGGKERLGTFLANELG
jgi:DNA-binding NarL/FixJ family response regulator